MREPWLRGTLGDVDAMRRQVLHALEQALEDVEHACAELSDEEVNARPFGMTPVAFHLRHMARSLDRLTTYMAGGKLSERQLEALRGELEGGADVAGLMLEFEAGVRLAMERVRGTPMGSYEDVRGVGRDMVASTVGGLMVHCAEHTMRHVGQVVTSCRVLVGMRGTGGNPES